MGCGRRDRRPKVPRQQSLRRPEISFRTLGARSHVNPQRGERRPLRCGLLYSIFRLRKVASGLGEDLLGKKLSVLLFSSLLAAVSVLTPTSNASARDIDESALEKIVNENTVNPGYLGGILKFDETVVLGIGESSSVEVLSPPGEYTSGYVFERQDGLQVVSVHPEGGMSSSRFRFEGKELLALPDGAVLVNSTDTGETEFYIDPAWAADVEGESIDSHFEIEGDTLVQVIGNSRSSTMVLADPYIRDVKRGGRKIGQELVFSKKETAAVASGGAVACARVAGWLAVACATAPAVASYALSQDNCLAIRALGSAQAPNLIFPVSARC